jgi:hypothetical protein
MSGEAKYIEKKKTERKKVKKEDHFILFSAKTSHFTCIESNNRGMILRLNFMGSK